MFWAQQGFFLKIQKNHFWKRVNPILNTCHQVQPLENLINRFREKFKSADFHPKMLHSLNFGHNFFLKIQNSHFCKLFNEPKVANKRCCQS